MKKIDDKNVIKMSYFKEEKINSLKKDFPRGKCSLPYRQAKSGIFYY